MTKDGERLISSLGLLQSVPRHEERNVNTETEERSSIQHSFITILTRVTPEKTRENKAPWQQTFQSSAAGSSRAMPRPFGRQ